MKKLFFSLLAVCIFSSFVSAQFNAGIGFSVKPDGFILGLQAKALIGVHEKWTFSPAFNYYITNDANYGVDADVQYQLITIADNVNIFPMAGINWTEYGEGAGSDIGINVGIFSDFRIGTGLHIYLEPKFLLSDAHGFIFTTGVLF